MRPAAPRPPHPAGSPSSSASSSSSGSFHRERERSPHTPLPPPAPLYALGAVYPIPRTTMSDARRSRSLFSRRRVAPPTPPPPSPPPSNDEPSVETYDPATELVGDPNEPHVAEHIPIGAPEAYYSDASYGPEHKSASTDSAPSSHHSSGSSFGSVSLGYGSASSELASDGASDDDLTDHLDVDRPVLVVYSKMATSKRAEARARTTNDLPARSVTPTELIPQTSHHEATLIHGECYIQPKEIDGGKKAKIAKACFNLTAEEKFVFCGMLK
ncbi:hypothetical protein PIB30_050257 [Stylosanthes scabra]|uniref:Uncharacterized protein n=1 Tax=Stylosanthes scabra TaxID=79078 RepID=A0ABU6TJS3_9FABA|nr:hypothetical protein [Stylosanthes scabra]